MRVSLIAVGRLKGGAERDLASRYIDRAMAAARNIGLTGVDVRETSESRARRPEDRKAEEGRAIAALLSGGSLLCVLDESGKNLGSPAFAAAIGKARDNGISQFAMIIGGADGIDPALRQRADIVLAFGAMTWPHQMVRVMAAEQIYRAVTILGAHPYHRA